MQIEKLPSGQLATNTYIVGKHDAVIIDAAPLVNSKVIFYCKSNNINVKRILLTHGHWDHIADLFVLKSHFNAPIFIHEKDSHNLRKVTFSPISITPVNEFSLIRDGDNIPVEDGTFKVIHTPGHSPGSCCFYHKKEGLLFCGDTLFKKSFGRLDLPESVPELMPKSLNTLANLPPETMIFPGHGENSTIGEEAEWIKKGEKP